MVERTSTAPDPKGDVYKLAKKRMDRASKAHGPRCDRFQRRLDAWLATRKRVMDDPKVRFAAQRMDVLLSYITAEKPVGRVAPLSHEPKCIDAAKLMDKAINEWRRRDNRTLKLYEWMLMAIVFGVAPAKSYWVNERAEVSYRVPIIDPVTGEASGERLETKQEDVRDQPSMALVNPFDFAWDPAATRSDLSDADYVCHWTYPTLRYVQAYDVENAEAPRVGIYHNTSDLQAVPESGPQSKRRKGRDLAGHVELCEVWTRDRLVVIANGSTCIRDDPNPFLHHDLPYIIGTTQFSLTGEIEPQSEIDLITPIQNDLWNIYAQYRENLTKANELNVLFDGKMSDPEPIINALRSGEKRRIGTAIAYESTNDQPPITWSPSTALLTSGQSGMEGYKRDMDDMSGVGPYISGSEEKSVDPKTATEVSTLQGASMRRISKTRNMLASALERESNLELKLTRQFMNKPLEITIEGNDPESTIPGDDWSFDIVDPLAIMNADLEYRIRDADENMDQEQKRSEANNRLTMTLNTAQVAVQLGQGAPNIKKAYEDYIEAYGEDDPEDWWIEPPPPLPMPIAPPGSAGPPQGAGPLGASPLATVTPPRGPGRAAPTPSPNGVLG